MKPSKARWSIALLILAIFFDTIEMTAVITALPTMGRSFPQTVNWLAWLTTASLLAAAVAMAVGGRIADDWGAKKTFMLGLTFSNLGSLLAGLIGYGLPKSMLLLIILRFVQGFGAGTYAPIGLKLISLVMKGGWRTQTIGVAGMVVPLAAVLGPNVGGFLVGHFPWQVIFLLNAGIGLAIMLLAGFLMEEMVTPNEKAPLDIAGIGAFSGAVLSAMLALTLARQAGSVAPLTIGLLVLAVVLAAILPRLETRSRAPFLEPALLTARGMGVVLGLSFLQGVTMYSVLFFLSF
ncbi:MAG: MFS transporter [Bacillota bacterium]